MFDAPIHYIVLSRKDNTFDMDWFDRYNAVLDEIEASTGPGIMITIGTGQRIFSSGFNLEYWLSKIENKINTSYALSFLQARLLEFPMPTMCVFNGKAVAGGFLFGSSFDRRIMDEKKGLVLLNEIQNGLPMPASMLRVLSAKFSPKVCLKVLSGQPFDVPSALQDGLIDATYNGIDEVYAQI